MGGKKVALVTGAGGGLGAAITEALADIGYKVAALDQTTETASKVADSRPDIAGAITPIVADIRSAKACNDAVEETVSQFGNLHLLVNNAGIGQSIIRENYYVDNIMFWEVSEENWDSVMDTNVKAAFMLAKAALPHMLEAGWGRIINVTTSLDTMIRRGWTPYGTSKAALEACSAIWSKDLEDKPVTVNVLVPGGPVNTGMVPMASAPNRDSLIQPEVMKQPVCWLASNDSDNFNGRRMVATLWDVTLSNTEAAYKASSPAAWPGLGAQAVIADDNPMQGV